MKLYVWTTGDGECAYHYMAFADSKEEAIEMLLADSYKNELKEKKEIMAGKHMFASIYSKEELMLVIGANRRYERLEFRFSEPKVYKIEKGTLYF